MGIIPSSDGLPNNHWSGSTDAQDARNSPREITPMLRYMPHKDPWEAAWQL